MAVQKNIQETGELTITKEYLKQHVKQDYCDGHKILKSKEMVPYMKTENLVALSVTRILVKMGEIL